MAKTAEINTMKWNTNWVSFRKLLEEYINLSVPLKTETHLINAVNLFTTQLVKVANMATLYCQIMNLSKIRFTLALYENKWQLTDHYEDDGCKQEVQ